MIKIRKLDGTGHTDYNLSRVEAQAMINVEGERYFVVNTRNKQIIREVHLKDGQELTLIPRIQGG